MKIKLKIVTLAVLSSLLFYIVSPAGLINSKVLANGGEGSTIGGILVSDLKDDELRSALSNGIDNWTSEPIVVSGGGASIEFDSAAIQFDIDSTITTFKNQTDKPWYAFWQKKPVVHIPFVVKANDDLKQQISAQPLWETEGTYNNVMLNVSYLRNHEIDAVMSNVAAIDSERLAVTIKEVPAELTGVNQIVEQLNGKIIGANEEFNFLSELDSILGSTSRESLSFVASVLYETSLKINAQITDRHKHQELPNYFSPGLDAEISIADQKNLSFINKLNQPMQLKLTREGLNLKVEAFAAVSDNTATVRVSNVETVEPRTITRYSYNLSVGKSQVVQQGKDGMRVSVFRTNSETGLEELVSRDYYPPTNKIVVVSSRQPATSSGGGTGGSTNNNDSGKSTGNSSNNDGTNTNDKDYIDDNLDGVPDDEEDAVYDKGGNRIK